MTENVAIQPHELGGKPASANETGSDQPKLPQQVEKHPEDHKADQLTFFGLAPLRKRLNGHAVDFLLNHRRWAKPEDSPEVVSKKNVIMMFTIHAEIEDCLVPILCEPVVKKLDKAKPLGLLQHLLDIPYMKGPRAYTFAVAILKAYTNSRHEQILEHLVRNELPPEPEDPMDKVLLSVVDRRLVFKHTREPLHTTPVFPHDLRLQHHRLKLEGLLSNEIEADKVFTAFVPMVPEEDQMEWPRPWHLDDWLYTQERRCRKAPRSFKLGQTTIANGSRGPTTDTGSGLTDTDCYKVSGGLYMYRLAIRLACNYISADPRPEMVQTFTNTLFKTIENFAKDLENNLGAHPPDSVGQSQDIDQGEIVAVATVINPAEVNNLLGEGMFAILMAIEIEDMSLLHWSWIAREVQQGKLAIQNACQESLARRLA